MQARTLVFFTSFFLLIAFAVYSTVGDPNAAHETGGGQSQFSVKAVQYRDFTFFVDSDGKIIVGDETYNSYPGEKLKKALNPNPSLVKGLIKDKE